jgi:hypothetical protein
MGFEPTGSCEPYCGRVQYSNSGRADDGKHSGNSWSVLERNQGWWFGLWSALVSNR